MINPNETPTYQRRTLARQQHQSDEVIKTPPTEAEIYQRFQSLPIAEQQRIDSLPISMRLTALRALGNQPTQTAQTAQTTPQESIAPEKLILAESFARALPLQHQVHLESLSGDKRLCRIWELKDYADRHGGELPRL